MNNTILPSPSQSLKITLTFKMFINRIPEFTFHFITLITATVASKVDFKFDNCSDLTNYVTVSSASHRRETHLDDTKC